MSLTRWFLNGPLLWARLLGLALASLSAGCVLVISPVSGTVPVSTSIQVLHSPRDPTQRVRDPGRQCLCRRFASLLRKEHRGTRRYAVPRNFPHDPARRRQTDGERPEDRETRGRSRGIAWSNKSSSSCDRLAGQAALARLFPRSRISSRCDRFRHLCRSRL